MHRDDRYKFAIKVRDVAQYKEPFQQALLKKQISRLCMKEETTFLDHLNVTMIINELLAVDVNMNKAQALISVRF